MFLLRYNLTNTRAHTALGSKYSQWLRYFLLSFLSKNNLVNSSLMCCFAHVVLSVFVRSSLMAVASGH